MGDGSIIEGFAVGALAANCYLIVCPETDAALVVDPGDEAERILARIRERGVTVARILHTHGHFDHISATEALLVGLETPVPLLAHRADAYLYTREARGSVAFVVACAPVATAFNDDLLAPCGVIEEEEAHLCGLVVEDALDP